MPSKPVNEKKNPVKEKNKARKFKDLTQGDKDELLEELFIMHGYCAKK